MLSVFSGGGNQSVLLATVLAESSNSGVEGEWSVSVVVENELGNSSEIVVVLQGECKLCERMHSSGPLNCVLIVLVVLNHLPYIIMSLSSVLLYIS